MRSLILLFFVVGCAPVQVIGTKENPVIERPTLDLLVNLRAPERKAVVAVYDFPDFTGQRKTGDNVNVALFSTAVTQGADLYLVDALMNAGKGSWFTVIERKKLGNLTRERQLVIQTRETYDGEGANKLQPLLFAGLIMEGGIVSYDTNYQTGGIGARMLGIGVNNIWRRDRVTVSLRAVLVQTGEILLNVSTSKTIYSTGAGSDVFRFYESGTELIEIESGLTESEAVGIATKTAIEAAVYAIIQQGIELDMWDYKEGEENENL
jgi:curli production assembly/transport component CsgG